MRASKMDGIEGEARKLVQNALVDRDVGAQALFNELEELGAVEEHELTLGGVSYYLLKRRAAIDAIDAGDMEEPELEEGANGAGEPETPVEALTTGGVLVPMGGGRPPSQGYVVLPDGAIWTTSPDAALELQRRILQEKC